MVNTSNPAELQAKFEELVKDEEYLRSLMELEEPADVQKALEEKGIELTIQEIVRIRDVLLKSMENHNGELSEEELGEVTGGESVFLTSFLILAFGALIVRACGVERW